MTCVVPVPLMVRPSCSVKLPPRLNIVHAAVFTGPASEPPPLNIARSWLAWLAPARSVTGAEAPVSPPHDDSDRRPSTSRLLMKDPDWPKESDPEKVSGALLMRECT